MGDTRIEELKKGQEITRAKVNGLVDRLEAVAGQLREMHEQSRHKWEELQSQLIAIEKTTSRGRDRGTRKEESGSWSGDSLQGSAIGSKTVMEDRGTPFLKLEFPDLDGSNLENWVYKSERYFDVEQTAESKKVRLASVHMYGKALQWHYTFIRDMGKVEMPTWVEYVEALTKRFGKIVFDDPRERLKNIGLEGIRDNLYAYMEEFESCPRKVLERVELWDESVGRGGCRRKVKGGSSRADRKKKEKRRSEKKKDSTGRRRDREGSRMSSRKRKKRRKRRRDYWSEEEDSDSEFGSYYVGIKVRPLVVSEVDENEGEKGDTASDVSAHGERVRGRLARTSSVKTMEAWVSQQRGKKLYIVLISIHGLIRGENIELGHDPVIGGQVQYVAELAWALGSMPGVYRVDLLTRQVSAPDVDGSYGEPTEMLAPRNHERMAEMGESADSYIIRVPFEPRDKYVPKEHLWLHIPEFVDGARNQVIQMSKILGEQIGNSQPVCHVAIQGHYADAGDSTAFLSEALNDSMFISGHSLGRDKWEQLLKQGQVSREEINTTYKVMHRIEVEELSLDASQVINASPRQETVEQWRLYDGFDPILEKKARAGIKRNGSCYGRYMLRMAVIPLGMEFRLITPEDGDVDSETEGNEDKLATLDPTIWSEIMRFLNNPRKPKVLQLARPDPKKSITTLVKAFGECRPLRELANLTLIMGNRDGMDEISSTNVSVLVFVLKFIDNGLLVDPHVQQSIDDALQKLVADERLYGKFVSSPLVAGVEQAEVANGASGKKKILLVNEKDRKKLSYGQQCIKGAVARKKLSWFYDCQS